MVVNKCRFCGKEADYHTFDIHYTYWRGVFTICHISCKELGAKEEAYECQVIDADCNDCKHFKRGKMLQGGKTAIWEGQCLKFDKTALAYPVFCSGHKCFEHRKSGYKDIC